MGKGDNIPTFFCDTQKLFVWFSLKTADPTEKYYWTESKANQIKIKFN